MKKRYLFIVHEFSLPGFVLFALLGRNVFVIDMAPIFPVTGRFLKIIVEGLIARGKASWAVELIPSLQPQWEYPYRSYFYDVFGKKESWERSYFGFPLAEEKIHDYAYPYKAAVTDYMGRSEWAVLAIDALSPGDRSADVVFCGVSRELAGAAEAFADRKIFGPMKLQRAVAGLLNFPVLLLYTFYSMFWVLSRVRLWKDDPKPVLMAADFINDESDFDLYEAMNDHGSVLLVSHNKAIAAAPLPDSLREYERSEPWSGIFGLRLALQTIWMMIVDGLRLYRFAGGHGPGLFRILATLPYWRAVYRAFFQAYQPTVFWGRDPCGPHHALRRLEANAVGCQSWAVLHGYSFYAETYPVYRYLDYDKLFVMGRFFYERFYRETWAQDMDVVASTTFRATRALCKAMPTNVPDDILVMCSVFAGEPALVDLIRHLAEAFPKRTVLLQVKHSFVDLDSGSNFIEQCTKGLANVRHTRDDVLALFSRARYAFSDPATVVGEAIQFGLYTFFTDVCPTQKVVPFREFPGLCVSSGAEAVARIEGIETGHWHYPVDQLANFVELSGEPCADCVLQEAGFEATTEAISRWPQGNRDDTIAESL